MRTVSIKYPTVSRTRKIGDKVYVVEAIRDLDEAIDLVCEALTPEEQRDPFAEDLCPYFGILWPAATGLAEYLAENPELVRGKRVLELGAGLGLPSLVSAHLGGDVLATDYHPDAEAYFLRNCRHSSVRARYRRLNWRAEALDGEVFDVVLGSDVLYESKHPREVARGLVAFAKPGGIVILSDPGRAYVQQFLAAMREEGRSEQISHVPADGQDIFIFRFTV
jgi:predicted nicotinamide N-methyase